MRDYLYSLATDKYNGFIASIIKAFLLLFSFIYGLVVRILILFYSFKPYRLNCKVISVGNITVGGTGKTSLVEFIAGFLKTKGHKVAILSRGYKRPSVQYAIRSTQYESMGDEPYMLAKKLGDIPVIVDADRIRGAKEAIKEYDVDTVILDDGFQQWRIKKDLEIVTIDATDPFGNRHLLPRGILRQSLSSLKCADILVLTKTNLQPETQDIKDFLNQFNPDTLMIESIHRPLGFSGIGNEQELIELESIKGKTVTLVSGIGDPDSFENLITSLGIDVGLSFKFADHHNYTKEDFAKVIDSSKEKNIDTIITTEKDAVRLKKLQVTSYKLQVLVLRIDLAIPRDEEKFHNRLLKLYSI